MRVEQVAASSLEISKCFTIQEKMKLRKGINAMTQKSHLVFVSEPESVVTVTVVKILH